MRLSSSLRTVVANPLWVLTGPFKLPSAARNATIHLLMEAAMLVPLERRRGTDAVISLRAQSIPPSCDDH